MISEPERPSKRAVLAILHVGAHHLQRCIRIAVGEAHLVDLAIAMDAQLQPFRERAFTTETPTPCRPPETL